MDDRRFDTTTAVPAGSSTRGQTLSLLGGLGLAGLLRAGTGEAKGKKHHKKKGKGKHKHRGGGQTVPPQPGFTVNGRQILTPAGTPVVLRGVNKMFLYEQDDPTGQTILPQIALSGANSVRIVWGIKNDRGQETKPAELNTLISTSLANGLLPMIELHGATGDFGKLPMLVDYWTRPAVVNVINSHSQALLVNIGNEVGDNSISTDQFISGYTSAVQRMRNANIHTPLVIDASNFGKNLDILNASASTLLANDPDHNLIFSAHLYWGIHEGADANFIATKLNEAVAANYPLIVGEFSQFGADIGDGDICHENGRVDYATIVEQTRQQGIGWYAWEWGPGNSYGGAGCEVMDLTTNGQFDTLQAGWPTDVVVTLPGSIKNTATRIV